MAAISGIESRKNGSFQGVSANTAQRLCIPRHNLKPTFLRRKYLSLHHSTSLRRTITVSLTDILKSQRMCDHLTNPGLLIDVREQQALSLLSQLVLANAVGFAQCHEEWQNL